MIGEYEVDGKLRRDRRRRRRPRLHEGERSLRGIDVGGDLLPPLDERRVLCRRSRREIGGERPAAAAGGGEGSGEEARCLAIHFGFLVLDLDPSQWEVSRWAQLIS